MSMVRGEMERVPELTKFIFLNCIARGDEKTLRKYTINSFTAFVAQIMKENLSKYELAVPDQSSDDASNEILQAWQEMIDTEIPVTIDRKTYINYLNPVRRRYAAYSRLLWHIYSSVPDYERYLENILRQRKQQSRNPSQVIRQMARTELEGWLEGIEDVDSKWYGRLRREYLDE